MFIGRRCALEALSSCRSVFLLLLPLDLRPGALVSAPLLLAPSPCLLGLVCPVVAAGMSVRVAHGLLRLMAFCARAVSRACAAPRIAARSPVLRGRREAERQEERHGQEHVLCACIGVCDDWGAYTRVSDTHSCEGQRQRGAGRRGAHGTTKGGELHAKRSSIRDGRDAANPDAHYVRGTCARAAMRGAPRAEPSGLRAARSSLRGLTGTVRGGLEETTMRQAGLLVLLGALGCAGAGVETGPRAGAAELATLRLRGGTGQVLILC
jgi:hypothetical protein